MLYRQGHARAADRDALGNRNAPPAEALTYRSRVPGREIEITWLAPEGAQVHEGDPWFGWIDRAATDLERAMQAMRQAELDAQVAEAERRHRRHWIDCPRAGARIDTEEARFDLEDRGAKGRANPAGLRVARPVCWRKGS